CQRADGFVHAAEPKQALGRWKAAGPGILHHDGLPAGQIADGAVAGPAVHKLGTVRFDTAELPSRSLDIGMVLLGRGAHVPRLANLPSQGLETPSPLLEVLAEAHRQLELRGDPGGEIRVLEE